MKRFLVLIAMAAGAALSFAQGHGPAHHFRFAGSDGGSMVQLALQPDVQTELKVTADQKTKLAALENAMQTEVSADFAAMQKNKVADPNKQRGTISATGDKFAKSLPSILNKDQYSRLRQILLQKAGYGAVLRPDVQEDLGLTKAQKAGVAKAEADLLAGFDKFAKGDRSGDPMAMVRARDKAVGDVLTAKQKAKFDAMQGKPFKFASTGMGMPPMKK